MALATVIEDMPPDVAGRARDLPASPHPVDQGGAFEALLYPNRSLPPSGFIAVMSVVIIANVTFGAAFFAIGAWPVLGFCGLDILLVWAAFKLSYRQGRLHERVRVTPGEILVSRVLPSGHETRWRLQTFWTKLVLDRPDEHEAQVRLVSKGRSLVLGSFLSPEERAAFAETLESAMHDASRHPDASTTIANGETRS